MRALIISALGILYIGQLQAQRDDKLNEVQPEEKWSYHYQFTSILQGHPAFTSPYSGQNSLSSGDDQASSVTSTLFVGRKLWKGASVFINPEMTGGKGIGSTLGIAGFTNGECYRIGDPQPVVYIGRAFIRQHFALGKNCGNDTSSALVNQLGGEKLPCKRLTITAGKFSVEDVFDNNACSHDPRTHFMNWSLMSNGAWDYPANTRGYTWGLILELVTPSYAIRAGATAVVTQANLSVFDTNLGQAHAEMMEFEKDFSVKGRKGAIRLLAYENNSHAGNYRTAINNLLSGEDKSMNVNSLSTYGGVKYGFGINAEQGLTDLTSAFLRAGWNDGQTASWMYTEIDQSLSGGVNIKGTKWKRPKDVLGIAGVINNISNDHWDFLNYGGYGFIIGDGQLPHYGSEMILETYYSCELAKTFWLSADYQYVQNPAYNRDRGPVNVYSLRAHIEF